MTKGPDGRPLNVELFGHSDCYCWGLLLNEKGVLFGKKCD